MKTTIRATVVALTLLGAVSAYAAGGKAERPMPVDFGPTIAITMAGHDMHIQAIKTEEGEFIVMSREDAEALMGHKLDVQFVPMKEHASHN